MPIDESGDFIPISTGQKPKPQPQPPLGAASVYLPGDSVTASAECTQSQVSRVAMIADADPRPIG